MTSISTRINNVGFVWDNFGPMHVDRCDATANLLKGHGSVFGIELFEASYEYEWVSESGEKFKKITLFTDKRRKQSNSIFRAAKIVWACMDNGIRHVFVCNYDKPEIFLAAIILRLLGRHVYVMGCSKFDDSERTVFKELAKRISFLPYEAAIASGIRSRDYMRFLGVPKNRVFTEYNTLSVSRMIRNAGGKEAREENNFESRDFVIVARMVPKKNLFMALEAFALYRRTSIWARKLHFCGSGPLESALRQKASEMGLTDDVVFHGFLQTADISVRLLGGLALILPSIEEQFGNVVIEALALGVPVLLSDVCGARDKLVRSGVNGFVFEPDNPEGLAYFMGLVSSDQKLWTSLATKAKNYSIMGDSDRFAEAVHNIVHNSDLRKITK